MDYVLKPSLERMVLTKIAVVLWDQHVIKASSRKMFLQPSSFEERRELLLEAEDNLREKVPQLLLPKSLKNKLLKFVSAIGWEIFKWRRHHSENFNLDTVLLSDLCWSPHGTVDAKKTADAFILNENVDITRRYRLACAYCLDNPKLWDKILENPGEQFCSDVERDYLVVLWTHKMKEEVDKLDNEIERRWRIRERSPYQYAFEYAASRANKVAAEYFLQRLTHEEREVSLVSSAKSAAVSGRYRHPSYFPNILCSLLSQMDEWEQVKVFKEYPRSVLRCLLEWPWQSVFMETANRMWDFLSGEDFQVLLTDFVIKVKQGYKDYDYQKLLQEFWQQSPNALKEYVLDGDGRETPFYLYDLLEMEGKEIVRVILNSATVERRREILFSRGGIRICRRFFKRRKWDSLKLFVRACLSSKEVMIEFREMFKNILCNNLNSTDAEWRERSWNEIIGSLLDDLIQENNKRSAEEDGESSSCKRLHTTEFEDVTHCLKKKWE